jgi:tetratricopeptide (TPR) repeat protein
MLRAFIIVAALAVAWASSAALLGVDPLETIGPDVPADLAEQQLRSTNSPGAAIRLYEIAMLRNPAAPRRWTQLGNALLAAGETTRAAACFERALQLGPRLPEVLKRVAEFDFAQGHKTEALSVASQLLILDTSFEEPVFEMYSQQSLPVAQVLEIGTNNERTAQSYFEHLRKTSSTGDVEAAWQWLVGRQWVNPRLAQGYIETQLQAGNFEQASLASSRFLRPIDPRFLNPSLVFNGGFEVAPDGSPLEWTIFPFDGITIERDTQVAHAGAASLHLLFFNAGNALFGHVLQRLHPRPGRWRARAFIRTENVTSSQGIRLLISDSAAPERLYVQTPALAGTHDWTAVEAEFTVAPVTRELRIQVFRPKDDNPGGQLQGSAWIDDISVEPE